MLYIGHYINTPKAPDGGEMKDIHYLYYWGYIVLLCLTGSFSRIASLAVAMSL